MSSIDAEAEIYSAKLNLFDSYINRAWQRFNWLITIKFAWISLLITNYEKISKSFIMLYSWSIVGLFLSIIWLIIGYEDDISIQKYGKELKEFENILLKKIDIDYLNIKKSHIKHKFKVRQTGWLYKLPIFFAIIWSTVIFIIYFNT